MQYIRMNIQMFMGLHYNRMNLVMNNVFNVQEFCSFFIVFWNPWKDRFYIGKFRYLESIELLLEMLYITTDVGYVAFLYRKRLFSMINELPTVYEVVSGRKSTKEKITSVNGTNNAKSSVKKVMMRHVRGNIM